jgi:predicted nucleotidyltransferase
VTFPALALLPPGQAATYTIDAEALKAGPAIFRAEVTTSTLTKPLIQEESTIVLPANGSKPAPPAKPPRRYARAIGERFRPDKVILFGSYAYGTPNEDSDVDLLVIMPTRNKHGQRVKIRMAFTAPFPMDLLVRTPEEMKWRLGEGDLFHTEIVSKGKVLYEKGDTRMGEKGRNRSPGRRRTRSQKAADA